MQIRQFELWKQGEYTYPAAFGFVPNFRAFLHEDGEERPGMVIVPGGGYRVVSQWLKRVL